jgi:hypothetical protein
LEVILPFMANLAMIVFALAALGAALALLWGDKSGAGARFVGAPVLLVAGVWALVEVVRHLA